MYYFVVAVAAAAGVAVGARVCCVPLDTCVHSLVSGCQGSGVGNDGRGCAMRRVYASVRDNAMRHASCL